MANSRWIALLGALIALGFILPYSVFSDMGTWSGLFLFWLIFGIVVFALLVRTVMRWRV